MPQFAHLELRPGSFSPSDRISPPQFITLMVVTLGIVAMYIPYLQIFHEPPITHFCFAAAGTLWCVGTAGEAFTA